MASRKCFKSLLSLSGTPHVRACVAAAASLTQHEMKMSAGKCATQIPFTLSHCGVPALEKGQCCTNCVGDADSVHPPLRRGSCRVSQSNPFWVEIGQDSDGEDGRKAGEAGERVWSCSVASAATCET